MQSFNLMGLGRGHARRNAGRLVVGAFLIYVLVSMVSFLGWVWPGSELTSHFRPSYAVAAVVFLAFLLVSRRWVLASLAAAVAVMHTLPLVPYLVAGAHAAPCIDARPMRLMTINLHHRHADMRAVEALIRRERPDAVLLTEIESANGRALGGLRDLFPAAPVRTGWGTFEVMLFSRWNVAEHRVHRPNPSAPFLPVLEARLCARDGQDGCVTLIGMHASQPLSMPTRWQKRGFGFAARLAAKAKDGRAVIAGDLNTTPWASNFSDLAAFAGLRDAARGHPFRATWISRNPLFGLPLDHVLVGPRIVVRDRRVGPEIGSDHLPVTVDMAICSRPIARNIG